MAEERQIDAISIGIGANISGLKDSLLQAKEVVRSFDFGVPASAKVPLDVVLNTGNAGRTLTALTRKKTVHIVATMTASQTAVAMLRKDIRDKITLGGGLKLPFDADLSSAKTIHANIQKAVDATGPIKVQLTWEWKDGPPPTEWNTTVNMRGGGGGGTAGGGPAPRGPAPRGPAPTTPPAQPAGGGAAQQPAPPRRGRATQQQSATPTAETSTAPAAPTPTAPVVPATTPSTPSIITRPARPVRARAGTLVAPAVAINGPNPATGSTRQNMGRRWEEFQPQVGPRRAQGVPPSLDQQIKHAVARVMRTGDVSDIYKVLGPFVGPSLVQTNKGYQFLPGSRMSGYNVAGLEGKQVNLAQLINEALRYAETRGIRRNAPGPLREFEAFVPRAAKFSPGTLTAGAVAADAVENFLRSAKLRAQKNETLPGAYTAQDIAIAGRLRGYVNAITRQMHAEDPKAMVTVGGFSPTSGTRGRQKAVTRIKNEGLAPLAMLAGARERLKAVGEPSPDLLADLKSVEARRKELERIANAPETARKTALAKDRKRERVFNEKTGKFRTITPRGLPFVQEHGFSDVESFVTLLDTLPKRALGGGMGAPEYYENRAKKFARALKGGVAGKKARLDILKRGQALLPDAPPPIDTGSAYLDDLYRRSSAPELPVDEAGYRAMGILRGAARSEMDFAANKFKGTPLEEFYTREGDEKWPDRPDSDRRWPIRRGKPGLWRRRDETPEQAMARRTLGSAQDKNRANPLLSADLNKFDVSRFPFSKNALGGPVGYSGIVDHSRYALGGRLGRFRQHVTDSQYRHRLPIDSLHTSHNVGAYGGDAERVQYQMDELAAGRRLVPIEVSRIGKDDYISDGHHRREALLRSGAKSVDAYVTSYPDEYYLKAPRRRQVANLLGRALGGKARVARDFAGKPFSLEDEQDYQRTLEHPEWGSVDLAGRGGTHLIGPMTHVGPGRRNIDREVAMEDVANRLASLGQAKTSPWVRKNALGGHIGYALGGRMGHMGRKGFMLESLLKSDRLGSPDEALPMNYDVGWLDSRVPRHSKVTESPLDLPSLTTPESPDINLWKFSKNALGGKIPGGRVTPSVAKALAKKPLVAEPKLGVNWPHDQVAYFRASAAHGRAYERANRRWNASSDLLRKGFGPETAERQKADRLAMQAEAMDDRLKAISNKAWTGERALGGPIGRKGAVLKSLLKSPHYVAEDPSWLTPDATYPSGMEREGRFDSSIMRLEAQIEAAPEGVLDMPSLTGPRPNINVLPMQHFSKNALGGHLGHRAGGGDIRKLRPPLYMSYPRGGGPLGPYGPGTLRRDRPTLRRGQVFMTPDQISNALEPLNFEKSYIQVMARIRSEVGMPQDFAHVPAGLTDLVNMHPNEFALKLQKMVHVAAGSERENLLDPQGLPQLHQRMIEMLTLNLHPEVRRRLGRRALGGYALGGRFLGKRPNMETRLQPFFPNAIFGPDLVNPGRETLELMEEVAHRFKSKFPDSAESVANIRGFTPDELEMQKTGELPKNGSAFTQARPRIVHSENPRVRPYLDWWHPLSLVALRQAEMSDPAFTRVANYASMTTGLHSPVNTQFAGIPAIFAHELGHVVDNTNLITHTTDLSFPKRSDYGGKSPQENFAEEFKSALLGGGDPHDFFQSIGKVGARALGGHLPSFESVRRHLNNAGDYSMLWLMVDAQRQAEKAQRQQSDTSPTAPEELAANAAALLHQPTHHLGHRAGGGRHKPWGDSGAYIVGEQGDEVFVPESAGWIIPHRLMDQLPKRADGGETGPLQRRIAEVKTGVRVRVREPAPETEPGPIARRRAELAARADAERRREAEARVAANLLRYPKRAPVPHAPPVIGHGSLTERLAANRAREAAQAEQMNRFALVPAPQPVPEPEPEPAPLPPPDESFLRRRRDMNAMFKIEEDQTRERLRAEAQARYDAAPHPYRDAQGRLRRGGTGPTRAHYYRPGGGAAPGPAGPPGTPPPSGGGPATATAGSPLGGGYGAAIGRQATAQLGFQGVGRTARESEQNLFRIEEQRSATSKESALRSARVAQGVSQAAARAFGPDLGQIFATAGGRGGVILRRILFTELQKDVNRAQNRITALQKQQDAISELYQKAEQEGDVDKQAILAEKYTDVGERIDFAKEKLRDYKDSADLASKGVANLSSKLKTLGSNFSGILVGTVIYGTVFKGIQAAIDAAVPALGSFIDEQTGLRSKATAVTSALGEQTKAAHGNADAVLATAAAEAGLNSQSLELLRTRLKATAEVKAGAQAQQGASDLYRAGFGQQGRPPEGLFGGYGGVLGTPFLAQTLGGGKGFSEIVQGDLSALGRDQGPDYIGDITKSLAYLTNPDVHKVVDQTAKDQGNPLFDALGIAGRLNPITGPTNMALDLAGGIGDQLFRGGKAPEQPLAFVPGAPQAQKATDLQTGYINNLNDEIKRAGGTAKFKFTADPKERALGAAAAAAAGDINGMTSAAQGFVVTLNGAIAGSKEYTTAVEQAARGAALPSADVVQQELNRQRDIAMSSIATQTGFQQTSILPQQSALQFFGQRPVAPGTGIVPPAGATGFGGFKAFEPATATASFQKYKGIATAALSFVTKYATQGWDKVATEAKVPPALLQSYKDVGQQILDIQTEIGNASATQQAVEYNHQLLIAKRTQQDALGLAGKKVANESTNLGLIERETFLLNRQSTALSLSLSQRQINFQRAVAGFQAPGLTSEERGARIAEAKIEADYAQKQLDIQKKLFGLGGIQFNVSSTRQLTDVSFALQDLERGHQIQIDTKLADQTIGALNQKLTIQGNLINTYMAQEEAIFAAKIQETATIAATATGTAFGEIFKGVDAAWTALQTGFSAFNAWASQQSAGSTTTPSSTLRGYEPTSRATGSPGGVSAPTAASPSNLPSGYPSGGGGGGGGGGATSYTHHGIGGYATGLLTSVSRPTTMTVGEAGTETVAVIRNPQTFTTGSNGGGGGGIVININNPTVRGDNDILAIARQVEKVMQKHASLILPK